MARLIGIATVLCVGVNVLAGDEQGEKDKSKKSDPMHPRMKMETSLGDFILELDAEKAPISTVNFIQYAEDGFYNGTIFHRVKKDFMIQGGGFTLEVKRKTEGLRSGIKWRGPSGDLTIDPITNHVIQDVHLARVKNQAFEVFKTIKQVYPSDVIDRCNLVENPDTNEAFTPDI